MAPDAIPGLAPGLVLDGRYVLEAEIGAGAFGRVYRARHARLGTACALKFLIPQRDIHQEIRRRFETEARSLLRIDHPAVIRFRDYFEYEGHPILVTELAPGESLDRLLARSAPLDEARAAEVTLGVLEALEAIHDGQILHRDVKPANVMVHEIELSTDRCELEIHLLDLGLARILDPEDPSSRDTSIDRPMRRIGTPHYMAPESFVPGRRLDARSDIYGAGVLLFEMLCGHRPFEGATGQDLDLCVTDRDAPALPTTVSAPVAAVVARALERDPDRRFPSAGAFACALREALAGRMPAPVPAAGASSVPTGPRRRGAKLVGGLVLMAAVAALVALFPSRPVVDPILEAEALLGAAPGEALAAARALLDSAVGTGDRTRGARAAMLVAAAIRETLLRETVSDLAVLELDADSVSASAWRLASGTDLEADALEALGVGLLRSGRPAEARSVLEVLASGFRTSPRRERTHLARARAELGVGRLREAEAVLAGSPDPMAAELRALAAALSPVLLLETDFSGLLEAEDLDGDGRAELIAQSPPDRITVAGLRSGCMTRLAEASLDGREAQSAALLRPGSGSPPILAVASLPLRTEDREGYLHAFEWTGGALVRRGKPIPVCHEARLDSLDLDKDGRPELVVGHVGHPQHSLSVFEYDPETGGLRQRVTALERPEGSSPFALEVYGAAVGGRPPECRLATGLWDLYGLASLLPEPGVPQRLRLSPGRSPGLVRSVAADGEGGLAFAVTHNQTRERLTIARMASGPAPGVYRVRADGSEEALFTSQRRAVCRPDGEPATSGTSTFTELTAWKKNGRLRWLGKYACQLGSRTYGRVFVVEDRPGAEPVWLAVMPYAPTTRAGPHCGDLDGDGCEDIAALDTADGRLCLVGLADPPLRALPAETDSPQLFHRGSPAGPGAVLETAQSLTRLGFLEEARIGFEEVIRADPAHPLAREALPLAVDACLRTGEFERGHALLGAARGGLGAAGPLPRGSADLLRGRLWEAQGLVSDALTRV